MGEFFCRGICGNPCGSIAHLQVLFYAGHLSFAKTSSAYSFNSLGKPDITC